MRYADDRVAVVEWRHGGHRLAYVAAIAAGSSGGTLLVTTRQAYESAEFDVLLRPLCERGALSVTIESRLENAKAGLTQVLSELRRFEGRVVIPEADRFLWRLLAMRLARRLPRNLGIIVMRSPTARWPRTIRGTALRIHMTVALVLLGNLARGVDLMLLEDPLSTGRLRTWRRPFLSTRFRLDDPQDLFDADPVEPIEFGQVPTDAKVVAVLGAIDGRKRLPEVLQGWAATEVDSAWLVIAGRQTERVRQSIEGRLPMRRTVFIDRFLTDGELTWTLDRCHCLIILYDGGSPSGMIGAAAMRGRWVVCEETSRTGAIAAAHGFAVLRNPREGLEKALTRCLELADLPESVAVASRATFSIRVIHGSPD